MIGDIDANPALLLRTIARLIIVGVPSVARLTSASAEAKADSGPLDCLGRAAVEITSSMHDDKAEQLILDLNLKHFYDRQPRREPRPPSALHSSLDNLGRVPRSEEDFFFQREAETKALGRVAAGAAMENSCLGSESRRVRGDLDVVESVAGVCSSS